MTGERRYREDEIGEIFEAAASHRASDRPALSSGDGLTLGELQEIGGEVGLPPERIAAAAAAIDLRRGALPRRTDLGMPAAVGRTVDLPRAPTDREWELLLGELRETFRAQGKDRSSGSVRQWSNGNLHAFVEPTEEGYRLRMGTAKGDAAAINRIGLAGVLMALLFAVLLLVGVVAEASAAPVVFAAMGAAALAYNALRLPAWAREREEQMEQVAARALALIGPAPEGDGA